MCFYLSVQVEHTESVRYNASVHKDLSENEIMYVPITTEIGENSPRTGQCVQKVSVSVTLEHQCANQVRSICIASHCIVCMYL